MQMVRELAFTCDPGVLLAQLARALALGFDDRTKRTLQGNELREAELIPRELLPGERRSVDRARVVRVVRVVRACRVHAACLSLSVWVRGSPGGRPPGSAGDGPVETVALMGWRCS